MLFTGGGLFLGCRSGFDTSSTIKANPVNRNILNHCAVNVSVVNNGVIHMPNGSVTEKSVAFPSAPDKTGSEITEPIVNTAVEPDVPSPVAGMPQIVSSFKTPVTWGPEKPGLRCKNPDAGNPIIIVLSVRPIAWDPNITVARAERLIVINKLWGRNRDRDRDLG